MSAASAAPGTQPRTSAGSNAAKIVRVLTRSVFPSLQAANQSSPVLPREAVDAVADLLVDRQPLVVDGDPARHAVRAVGDVQRRRLLEDRVLHDREEARHGRDVSVVLRGVDAATVAHVDRHGAQGVDDAEAGPLHPEAVVVDPRLAPPGAGAVERTL